MLTIKLHPVKGQQSYRSKKGNETFRYVVSGDAAEIAEFKTIKGKFFPDGKCPEYEGKPLYFSTQGLDGEISLRKNKEDYSIDLNEGEMFQALVKKYGIEWAIIKSGKAHLLMTQKATVPVEIEGKK